MTPLERRRLRPHHIAGASCGLDALALLSATGYCETGALPVWLYAVLALALLLGGVVLYQFTMRLYRDDRRRQRRDQRAARLDKIKEKRRGLMSKNDFGKMMNKKAASGAGTPSAANQNSSIP